MSQSESRGYRPPHQRRSRGSGGGWRGGRGGHRSSENNNITPAMSVQTSPEELERRRQRFANDDVRMRQQEKYGLVSRGEDDRLQRDPEARKKFFSQVQKEFSDIFADDPVDSLQKQMEVMSLDAQKKQESTDHKEKLSNVLMSLRKLREALLNTEPNDFTISVFMFSIRVSARIGHYQTYIPSINYLLKHYTKLTRSDLHEISNLYALHLAHFNDEHTKALEIKLTYCPQDTKLEQVLTAYRTHDYITWLRIFHSESDVPKYRMMEFGKRGVVEYAIDCIQKSYFQLPEPYLKEVFGMSLDNLKQEYRCGWKLQEGKVTVRERR